MCQMCVSVLCVSLCITVYACVSVTWVALLRARGMPVSVSVAVSVAVAVALVAPLYVSLCVPLTLSLSLFL